MASIYRQGNPSFQAVSTVQGVIRRGRFVHARSSNCRKIREGNSSTISTFHPGLRIDRISRLRLASSHIICSAQVYCADYTSSALEIYSTVACKFRPFHSYTGYEHSFYYGIYTHTLCIDWSNANYHSGICRGRLTRRTQHRGFGPSKNFARTSPKFGASLPWRSIRRERETGGENPAPGSRRAPPKKHAFLPPVRNM